MLNYTIHPRQNQRRNNSGIADGLCNKKALLSKKNRVYIRKNNVSCNYSLAGGCDYPS